MSNLLLYAVFVLCLQQFVVQAETQNMPVVNETKETDTVPNFVNRPQGISANNTVDSSLSKEVLHDSFVGFTAWAQDSQSLNAGDIVVFDGVAINEGGFYDVNTNTFTCPIDGVYFISVTLRGYGSGSNIFGSAYLMKESVSLFYLHFHASNTPENIVSQSITVMCTAEESIWVESGYDDNYLYGEGIPHTTFTIMLMNQPSRSGLLHNTFDGFTVFGVDQEYVNGDLIRFGDVLLNEGNHYYPDLNIFVCPVDGIYYVMITFNKDLSDPLMLGVEKNPYIILHSEDNVNPFNTVSNNRLVHCLQGEQISVKATGDGSVDDGLRTSFSVMLLQEQATTGKAHSSFTAFSAWKKVDQMYTSGDDIIFDGIMINEGNGFNLNTSTFECPVPGIYYVSINFKKVGSSDINLGVFSQSSSILGSVETSADNPENTVSNSCIVRCFPGAEIKVVATGSGSVHGDVSRAHTTFTIFLMYGY